jgi:hypothetical protein
MTQTTPYRKNNSIIRHAISVINTSPIDQPSDMNQRINELLRTIQLTDNKCKSSINKVILSFIGVLELKGSDEGTGDLCNIYIATLHKFRTSSRLPL